MLLHLLPETFSRSKRTTALAETLFLSLLFISTLYFLSNDISIKLDSYHDIVLLFLALITLYNGTLFGLLSLVTITFAIYFFTITYDFKTILSYLVFILLLGEFHFHFQRKKEADQEEKQYLKAKFRELSNAFFALKVSHDQLEKGYLLKPVTLRSLIIDLSQNIKEKNVYEKLFQTFQEAFSLKSAYFCKLHDEKEIITQIPLGDITTLEKSHEMILQCIETKKPVFLAENKMEMMNQEPILAVLPVLDIHNTLLGIFVIEKMDFLEFNMDNILKIQILLEYLAQEQFYNQHTSQISANMQLQKIDPRFQFEIDRLHSMYQHFGVHSAVVLVHTTNPAISLLMENFKTSKMRLLDMVTNYTENGNYFYLFLLPLERVSGAVSFKQRLEREMEGFSQSDYKILITEIQKIETMQQWIQKDAKRV